MCFCYYSASWYKALKADECLLLKRATCRREFVIRWNYTIFDYINKPCRSNVAIPGNSDLK